MPDLNFLTDFWRDRYLREYIKLGGSKIKFLTGGPGDGQSRFLAAFLAQAEGEGFAAVPLDAKTTRIDDFKEIYSSVCKNVNITGYLKECAGKIIAELGFDPSDVPENMSFTDYLADKNCLDPITKREIRLQLNRMFMQNRLIDNNFALCCSLLTGGLLGHPTLEASNRELILAWLAASKEYKLSDYKKLGLSPARITKNNARHMLRSLAEIIKLAGYSGLVVGAGNLEALVSDGGPDSIRYTKQRRDDAYEVIRELIDEIDTLRNIMFVFSFDSILAEDETSGIKSYQALWMRIQNEVAGERFNRFGDISDLGRLAAASGNPAVSPAAGAVDFNARHIIEALRSGISSREVGYCFSSARPKIMREIDSALSKTAEEGFSGGMFVSGKYGEGKTHLLNTVFNMAHERNMAVSLVSLSKETPFDKPHTIYSKIVQNTYLPGRLQPGFGHIFEGMTTKSPLVSELCEHCLKDFETNKLYYVLKSYLGTEDLDEKFMLLADMEGDFMPNAEIKKIYSRIYSEKVNFNVNFAKSKHTWDYFAFVGDLFIKSGYSGWVILFDEAELIGRMGKKTRLKCYSNMHKFIYPDESANLKSVYSIFAFNSSFGPEVIENKREYENIAQNPISPADDGNIKTVLDLIENAPQLAPLNKDEILSILEKIQGFHGKAYNWRPNIEIGELFSAIETQGYLLRTKIRAAVEILDQIYQYGKAGNITVNELGAADYSENLPPPGPDAE